MSATGLAVDRSRRSGMEEPRIGRGREYHSP
jgi:hypothetical protein